MNDFSKVLIIASIWLAPALGIWASGEPNVGWAWFLSYWATVESDIVNS